MKRRKFLLLMGIGAASLAIPAGSYFLLPSIRQHCILLIKRELAYLKIAEGVVEQYVDDYLKTMDRNLVTKLKWKLMYFLRTGPEQSTVLFELVKYFLLSSDFFIHKMDESKTVNYLGLYNPYKSPVPNPFSFALYPPDEIRDPV